MLDKKEKLVMNYIYGECEQNKTHLFSSDEILGILEKKNYSISMNELSEIMLYLSKEGFIDYVQTEGKKGKMFCVSLKNKGLLFKKDVEKEKRYSAWIILRTVLLTLFSFVIGLLLKVIF